MLSTYSRVCVRPVAGPVTTGPFGPALWRPEGRPRPEALRLMSTMDNSYTRGQGVAGPAPECMRAGRWRPRTRAHEDRDHTRSGAVTQDGRTSVVGERASVKCPTEKYYSTRSTRLTPVLRGAVETSFGMSRLAISDLIQGTR